MVIKTALGVPIDKLIEAIENPRAAGVQRKNGTHPGLGWVPTRHAPG